MVNICYIDELLKQIHALSSPIMAMAFLLDRNQLTPQEMNRLKEQFDIVMRTTKALQEMIGQNLTQERPESEAKLHIPFMPVGNKTGEY